MRACDKLVAELDKGDVAPVHRKDARRPRLLVLPLNLHRPVDNKHDEGHKTRDDDYAEEDGEQDEPPDGVCLACRPVGRRPVPEGASRALRVRGRTVQCATDEVATHAPPIRTTPSVHAHRATVATPAFVAVLDGVLARLAHLVADEEPVVTARTPELRSHHAVCKRLVQLARQTFRVEPE